MPDIHTGPLDAEDTPAPVPAAPSPSPQRQRSLMLRIALVMAASGLLLWATWATHTLLTLRDSAPHLVKVELADLVREYVTAEARSGEPAEAITAHTANFLKALNSAVANHAKHGTVVLLGNAVVDGDVPDITVAVRGEVYARTAPRRAPVPPSQVQP